LRAFASMRMTSGALAGEALQGARRAKAPYVFVYRVPMSYEEAERKLKALEMLRRSAGLEWVLDNATKRLGWRFVVYNETYRHLYERSPGRLLFSWTFSEPPPGGVIVHCPYYSDCYGREDEVLDVIAEGVKLAGVDPSGIVVVFSRATVSALIGENRGEQPPTEISQTTPQMWQSYVTNYETGNRTGNTQSPSLSAEYLDKMVPVALGLSLSATSIALVVALLRRGKPK